MRTSVRGQEIDPETWCRPPLRRPSLAVGVALALAFAVAAVLTAMSAACAGGAVSGLPVVASLADAKIGSLLLRDGERYVEAPRLATDVDITVSGPTARARLTQIFNNPTRSARSSPQTWRSSKESAVQPAMASRLTQ